MRRHVILTLLVALCLAGCMDVSREVLVRQDGSGTLTIRCVPTEAFARWVLQMRGPLAATETPEAAAERLKTMLADEARCLGEGVTLASVKEIRNDRGEAGHEVVFAFTDVTKLALPVEPCLPDVREVVENLRPGPAPEPKPIRFALAKGLPARLTIILPQPPTAEVAPEPPARPPGQEDIEEARLRLDGLRIRLAVRVAGTIRTTGAARVAADKTAVTLMDFDVAALIKDEQQFNRTAALGLHPDLETLPAKIKGLAGMFLESRGTVEIEF